MRKKSIFKGLNGLKPFPLTSKEQAQLDGTVRQSLELNTAISEQQGRLQEMLAQQEQLKGKLAGVMEMVCDAHDVPPTSARGHWDGEHFILTRATA